MAIDWDAMPAFDKLSTCVKCGYKIQEPVPAPEPKPAATKKESAAGPANMVLPVTAPPPSVAYCNGLECPWADDVVPEHMHQFCNCCGYEWVSRPLG